jgi:hypothetical protein
MMKTIQLKISNDDYNKYNLQDRDWTFSELVEKIKIEYAQQALIKCNKIAKRTSISDLTMDKLMQK